MTRDDVNKLLEQMVERAGSRVALAKEIGVTSAYVGAVLLGNREPGPAILDVLGLERQVQVTYVKKTKKKQARQLSSN